MRTINIPISVLATLSIIFVSACSWKEPPDLSPVHEGNTKNQVVQYLGEPEQSWQFDEYTVTLHYLGIPADVQSEFNYQTTYANVYSWGLLTPFILVKAAELKDEFGVFLLACFDDEDRLILFVKRKGLQRATQDAGSFADIGCREKVDCYVPFSEAVEIDADGLREKSIRCERADSRARWLWECLRAHRRDSSAQYTVAEYYRLGRAPIFQDLIEAYKWYSLAAKGGIDTTESRNSVAHQLTPDEIIKAERQVTAWEPSPVECKVMAMPGSIEKLASLGLASAQYHYAYSLNDFSRSWKWYCLAANQGHGKARYAVGNFYRYGLGPVTQDPVKSYLWYTLAGPASNAQYRDKLAAEMTTEQIAKADRLVAEWEPNSMECESISRNERIR